VELASDVTRVVTTRETERRETIVVEFMRERAREEIRFAACRTTSGQGRHEDAVIFGSGQPELAAKGDEAALDGRV